jgi:L-lactate utilization protein LutB
MEPDSTQKQDTTAKNLLENRYKSTRCSQLVSIEEIKQRIKSIRQQARENINLLTEELENTLSKKYPEVKLKWATDDEDAVAHINQVADGTRTISINNSSIILQELAPKLIAAGFTVVNSYHHEYDIQEREIKDYWDLPQLSGMGLTGTFNVVTKMAGLPDVENRKYLAVLGVNAISSKDVTTFFLEHFSNIHKDLKLANKVILVVGLDKIVETRDDAIFQTQCMGIFGMESVLLGIDPKTSEAQKIDEITLPSGNGKRGLHLIILDNGRTKLLQGKFRDLFLCIGCRACNQHCPVRYCFSNMGYIWTPKNCLTEFLFRSSYSIDVCLHCEACRLECPLDIDLPYLMWQAKMDYVTQHGTSLRHKVLGRPELLAKIGAPLASIVNWMMRQKPVRIPLEMLTGIDRRTNLPKFHSNTFRK